MTVTFSNSSPRSVRHAQQLHTHREQLGTVAMMGVGQGPGVNCAAFREPAHTILRASLLPMHSHIWGDSTQLYPETPPAHHSGPRPPPYLIPGNLKSRRRSGMQARPVSWGQLLFLCKLQRSEALLIGRVVSAGPARLKHCPLAPTPRSEQLLQVRKQGPLAPFPAVQGGVSSKGSIPDRASALLTI